MKRQIALAAFAALVLASPLGAQTPQPASTQPAAAAAAAPAATTPSDEKTAIGCVSAAADGRTFTFTESAAPTSTAPSAAAPAPAMPATSWTLVARSDIDLTKYVGKKIELTGTPDSKGGMSGNNSESSTRSAKATDGPRFHVKSVKVLAETCQ